MGQTDSETESDSDIKFAKERLLSLSPRSFMNSCIVIKDYDEDTGTHFEKRLKKAQKHSSAVDLLEIGNKGGLYLMNRHFDDKNDILIYDDSIQFNIFDLTTMSVIKKLSI